MQDFNSFSILIYYIISTTYQKIRDLFCPAHISGLSHSVLDKIENVEMKQFFKSINVALSEHQSSVVELVKRGFDGRHSDPESIILIGK